jgi:hypothetical protein
MTEGPGCNNEIKDRSESWQLHLRKERISGRIFLKTVELEIEKRIVGSSIGPQEVSDWTLLRGQIPPKRKKRHTNHSPPKRR